MTRITNNRPDPPKGPIPKVEKKPKLTRQKMERMSQDEVYLAIREKTLEYSLPCGNPKCATGRFAGQVHHILRGIHRRSALSLVFTWLPVCSDACHDAIEKEPIKVQILYAMLYIKNVLEVMLERCH